MKETAQRKKPAIIRIGPLSPGHPIARRWTFTRKRWTPLSYLFIDGDRVLLSAVQVTREGRGYLRDLIAGIEQYGRRVAVPCPLDRMEQILRHYGFVPHQETYEDDDSVDVWEKPQ